MSTPPLVSVMIITYNQEEYIEAAVRSALAQDHPALEVVVADDASTDRTPDILRALAAEDPRVRPVLGERNLGITGNSNRGLRACRGDFIAFQGGDDLLLPGKITAQVRWFLEHGDRVLCGHDVEYFRSTDNSTLSVLRARREGRGPGDMIRRGPPFPATAVMVRAAALPSHGFDERLPRVSDWKLWIDLLESGGSFGYVPAVFARYRIHDKNVTIASSDACWVEQHCTLALVEAERPHHARAARAGRSFLWFRRGASALRRGDRSGLNPLRASLAESLSFATRTPGVLLVFGLRLLGRG